VRSPEGGIALPIDARVEYTREGRTQVRQARVTCRMDAVGRVVALQ
jgi:hypothetical protein